MFKKIKAVDDIVAPLSKMVNDLTAFAKTEDTKSQTLAAEAEKLKADSTVASDSSNYAREIASKIASVFGVTGSKA